MQVWDDYSIPVRIAHEDAIEARRRVKREVEHRYREMVRADVLKETRAIDARVARVIQAELEKGESRTAIRRALKTNNNDVWKRYMSLVDEDVLIPDPDAGKIVYVTGTGWRWNITDRTVTSPDGEVSKIGTIWYEKIDGEEVATVLASKVPGANDNPPTMEERRELMELIRAGEVKPG